MQTKCERWYHRTIESIRTANAMTAHAMTAHAMTALGFGGGGEGVRGTLVWCLGCRLACRVRTVVFILKRRAGVRCAGVDARLTFMLFAWKRLATVAINWKVKYDWLMMRDFKLFLLRYLYFNPPYDTVFSRQDKLPSLVWDSMIHYIRSDWTISEDTVHHHSDRFLSSGRIHQFLWLHFLIDYSNSAHYASQRWYTISKEKKTEKKDDQRLKRSP